MAYKVLIKKERSTIVDGRKIVLSKFEKRLADTSKDFGTQFGNIKKTDLKKKKAKVGKEEYIILEPSFIDLYKSIKRLAQIITLKDIGAILTSTGIYRNSVVMDCGSGSGGLACFLAAIAKTVISYDIKSDHTRVASENAELLGLKNVEFKNGSIYNSRQISEKEEIDVLVLDVPEPWQAIKSAKKVLKVGGFLVSYSPNISQNEQFVKALTEDFIYEKTIEIMEREWTIKDKILRPRMKDIGHTAFISFARKIK